MNNDTAPKKTPGRKRKLSTSIEGGIRAEWHQGCLSIREIAEKFGVCSMQVRRTLNPEYREKRNAKERAERKPYGLKSQLASLKAEVERLRAGISSLLKNRPYCHHMAVSGIDEYQELAPVDDCGCSACASVRSALSLVSESTTQGS